ncbi:MAG: prolyl hydroxylase family protein [Gammaproteobacteria bacterium]
MDSAMHVVEKNAGAFVIENFFSSALCQHYITLGEEMGFRPSDVGFPDGARRAEEVRNNDRVVFEDATLAATLFERARPLLPPAIDHRVLSGFNERFRFYRYGPKEYFKWHRDGSVERLPDEASCLTFLIYLNDDFEGGATEFRRDVIEPRAGSALVFPHKLTHQGREIISGTKYVLRTDVMYRTR